MFTYTPYGEKPLTAEESVAKQNETSRLRTIDPIEAGAPSLVGFQYRGSIKAVDFECLQTFWNDRYAKDNPDDYTNAVHFAMTRFLQLLHAASICRAPGTYDQWAGALPPQPWTNGSGNSMT